MASRSSFLLPALVVERFFYESCLETLTSALKESRLVFVNQLNNGIQILKLVEDFCASKGKRQTIALLIHLFPMHPFSTL